MPAAIDTSRRTQSSQVLASPFGAVWRAAEALLLLPIAVLWWALYRSDSNPP